MSRLEDTQDCRRELGLLVRARYPLLWLVTHEEERALRLLRRVAEDTSRELATWTATRGFDDEAIGGRAAPAPNPADGDALATTLATQLTKLASRAGPRIVVLQDVHPYLDRPSVVRALREAAHELRSSQATIVLLGPQLAVPPELDKTTTVVDLPLPTVAELDAVLQRLLDGLDGSRIAIDTSEGLRERAVHAARGLTEAEAENVFAKALVRDARFDAEDLPTIVEEKKQILRKSGVLEYYETEKHLSELGGLAGLKRWLADRSDTFSERARAYGLPPPKGVLLLGVQGCGKSLTAKAVAAEWGLPLLRLDVGRIFDSFVGASEANMREAIRVAESLAPAVLWLDEIEKAFSGMTGGGTRDGGVGARVFGTLLTWLQERSAAVFVVATSNDIQSLPPELLRKGRFDEIFFVDLPSPAERESIWRIHLAARERDPARFDLARLVSATDGWSGAEIEQAVIAALFSAYPQGRDIETADVERAISETRPLSQTAGDRIQALRRWASTRARPAS